MWAYFLHNQLQTIDYKQPQTNIRNKSMIFFTSYTITCLHLQKKD